MKSNIKQSPLKVYKEIPSYWVINQIRYNELDSTTHYNDGWRDYHNPILTSNQKLGELIYDEINDIVTKQIVDKTSQEIESENNVYVPYSITPTQGRILLHQMGLLSTVKTAMEGSLDEPMSIYWEYALSWDRDNTYINAMAVQLGMSQTDLDSFFIEAEKIN